jgi:hypothetical protein
MKVNPVSLFVRYTHPMPSPPRSTNTLLLMAALIAAVRTARFDGQELEGMQSPRMRGQIENSLRLAEALWKQAQQRYPSWFHPGE